MRLPAPDFAPGDRQGAMAWVEQHLGEVVSGGLAASPEFVGGQAAADAALAAFDVAGYAARRNEVWPQQRQGASRLSPYIRHGLLSLPRVWQHVAGGPARDVSKFRDELLWQEYARHLYARIGRATALPLRYTSDRDGGHEDARWHGAAIEAGPQMACWRLIVGELESTGWLPNQARMWFASHWSVRRGWSWRSGEDYFFSRLLDGSRAANRLGWQWTVGAATGKAYGFSRWQVNKRAPGLCDGCALKADCPIEHWPDPPAMRPTDDDAPLRGAGTQAEAGPTEGQPWVDGEPAGDSGASEGADAVWLTAESLGDDDPALLAHPKLPAIFVFDLGLLQRLHLSSARLVFLAQCLADLGERREVHVHLGAPVDVLGGRRLAATYAPVPGWRRIARLIRPARVYPWPWLVRPRAGNLASFSAWRRSQGKPVLPS